jgi:hypothetical protein
MMARARRTALHADGTELPVEIGLSRVRWQRRPYAGRRQRYQRAQAPGAATAPGQRLEEFSYVAARPAIAAAHHRRPSGMDRRRPGRDAPASVKRNLDGSASASTMERLMGDLLSYARAGLAATEYAGEDIGVLVRGILEMQRAAAWQSARPGHRALLATRTPLETACQPAEQRRQHTTAGGRIRDLGPARRHLLPHRRGR